MGTEVDRNSCFTEYLKTKNLNEDAASKWDLFNGEVNGQTNHGLKSNAISGVSEYYKVLLRRTMLHQDEIFQNQVIELHRLYHVQKDLMLEMKSREERRLYNPLGFSNGSGSYSFLTKSMKTFKGPIEFHLPVDGFLNHDDAEFYENGHIIGPHHQNRKSWLHQVKEVNLTLGMSTCGNSESERVDLNEQPEEASSEEISVLCKKRRIDELPGFLHFENEAGKARGLPKSSEIFELSDPSSGVAVQNPKAARMLDLNLAPPDGIYDEFDSTNDRMMAQGQTSTASSFNPSIPKDFNGNLDLNFAATDDSCNGFVKGTTTRFVPNIDLEAPPVAPLSKDQFPSAEWESENALANEAAETIRMMSQTKPLPNSSAAGLLLLADAFSSDVSGMDCFELRALELKEVKMDHLRGDFKPPERECCTEERETRGRRRTKRRRQKKDFRKDILPTLSSLSRHDVTEDLQLMEDLMMASGQLWQPPRSTNVLGWGRTTRRAKRRRSPGNAAFRLVA